MEINKIYLKMAEKAQKYLKKYLEDNEQENYLFINWDENLFIPNQEHIQKILWFKYNNGRILYDFIKFCNDNNYNDYHHVNMLTALNISDSFNALWLIFFMYQEFKLEWKNNDWVKID